MLRRLASIVASRALVPLVLLGLVGVVLAPVLLRGLWFESHEGARYPLLFDHFRRAFLAGNVYPRWLPDLYGGYGYPTFCYYQPAFFFAALGFSFLPGYPASAMYGGLYFVLFLGALGAYRIGAEVADRATGLFCAALFMMTPYLWVDLYVRGDLSELTAMLLAPWSIYFLLVLARRTRARQPALPATVGLGLAIAAVIYAHPIPALFLLPSLGATACWMSVDRELRSRFLLSVGLAALVGLAASGPYWVPLALLRHEAGLERAGLGYYAAELHIVYFPQLLSRFWGFGGSGRLYNDGMSFQLGAPQLALALAGIWMCRKQRFFQASAAAYVILVVLMTPVALWLWRNVGVLRTMQFPWRILAITASLQLGCAAGIGYRLARSSTRGRALLVYGVLLGASLAWQSNQFAVQPVRDVRKELDLYNQDGRLSTMTNYAGVEEFLPRTAAYPSPLDPRGDNIPIVQPPPPASAGPLPDSTPYRIHYDVTAPVASEVIVNQLYFPGWRVTVDDQPISANVLRSSLLPDGRMVVPIPAGHHTLGARYAGPPGAGIYVALIVVVFGAVLLLWIAERRRPRLS